MAPLINLNDPAEQNYFAPNDKQKLLSGPIGSYWRQDILGGDDKLDRAELKLFCDTYQPAETCPEILKRTQALSIKVKKTQILDWMFSELNRPSLETHRQFWKLGAKAKTNGSSFVWEDFQKEAIALMNHHGFGVSSKKYETVASLLRAYLREPTPPAPEILADIFATGLQLVILEESLSTLKDFKGKAEMHAAITTLLKKIRAGKLEMKILPNLPSGTGAFYLHPKNLINLKQTNATEIFSFERSHARLHELFHFTQDLNCRIDSVLETEFSAYRFGSLTVYLLFPSHQVSQQLPFTNDYLDMVHDLIHGKLRKKLESLAKQTLSDAGLKTILPGSHSQVDLNKLEAEAKDAVDFLYSLKDFNYYRESFSGISPESKNAILNTIPRLQEMTEKLRAKPGIWNIGGIPQAPNSYFHLFFQRLALEYDLQTDQSGRNDFVKKQILPSFRALALTDRILTRFDGVEKVCLPPSIQLITDGPGDLNSKESKPVTAAPAKKDPPPETKKTPAANPTSNPNILSGLSLPFRIYGGSHTSAPSSGDVDGTLISLGTSLGFLTHNPSDHFVGGGGILGDFTLWGEGHLKAADKSKTFTNIYRHDVGLFGSVGYYSGDVDLLFQPAMGYRRIDAANEGLNQFWLGMDLMFQYPRAGLGLGARARVSPMESHDFGAFIQFDLPTLLRFQDY